MKTRGSNQRTRALTKIDVLAIIAVLVVVAALLLPALAAAKRKSSRIGCTGNLKQVGIAFRLWEGDNGDKYPMAVSVTNGGAMELVATGNVIACFQVMSNELSTPKILLCPEDTHRHCATNFLTLKNSNISYFINLDAAEMYPRMILDGDSNLEVNGKPIQPGILDFRSVASIAWTKDRHHGCGNIGLADGSAHQVTGDGWNSAVGSSTSGFPTNNAANRWLIP